jgi:phosphoribosylformimino-5-aminoimidazole carboxamide ribotide isomerase
MRVLPAVDLMGGATVQLVGGDPDAKGVEEADAVAAAARWVSQGATGLHVVDLDAALGRGSNTPLVRRIIDATSVPVQVGGGVRDTDAVRRLVEAGAHRVVVGTRAVEDPAWLAEASRAFPGRLVVALDASDGRVVSRGWKHATGRDVAEAAEALADLPVAGILCTAVQVEGRMEGVDVKTIARLVDATRHPVVASGGVSSLDDIRVLREAGCEACVVGMALYTGRLDLGAAMHAAAGEVSA